jgi:hypothetical protein
VHIWIPLEWLMEGFEGDWFQDFKGEKSSSNISRNSLGSIA